VNCSMVREHRNKTLEELSDEMVRGDETSTVDFKARAEFLLRQTEFVERQTKAVEETSKDTRRYTRYMFWSVIVLALSALANLLITIFK